MNVISYADRGNLGRKYIIRGIINLGGSLVMKMIDAHIHLDH
jgi:hypothetical protein